MNNKGQKYCWSGRSSLLDFWCISQGFEHSQAAFIAWWLAQKLIVGRPGAPMVAWRVQMIFLGPERPGMFIYVPVQADWEQTIKETQRLWSTQICKPTESSKARIKPFSTIAFSEATAMHQYLIQRQMARALKECNAELTRVSSEKSERGWLYGHDHYQSFYSSGRCRTCCQPRKGLLGW